MKKLSILILALVMCLTAFTACDFSFLTPVEPTPDETNTQADSAITLIKDDLKDWSVTAADYQLNAFTHQGDVRVEWSVNVGEEHVKITHDYENGIVYVDVNEESTTDVEYVLTAKVTDAEGNVRETSFTLVLPKDKLTTYAEYAAAEADANVKVQGVIVGIVRKADGWGSNSVYFQDADGGYYAYNVSDEAVANLAVGMTVKAVGTKDTYNGTYEVMNSVITVVSSDITTVTPADYTSIFTTAPSLDDASLVGKQSFLVTIKGVEITTQNASNGYLNFKLNGVESYVRISSSNNCITKAEAEALKALHAENFGNTADVTGLVSVYNGKFYLIPATGVPAISNIQAVEKTAEEKIAAEKENLTIDTSYSADGEYTLPVVGGNYSDVVISWASNNENVVVGENGVITVKVPDTKTEVTLTATITCGEVTDTKEITIVLNKSITAIADANAIGAAQGSDYTAEKYLIAGVVTEVKHTTYGNLYISDGTNQFYVYGLYDAAGVRYDAMTTAPQVGDYIVVLTVLGQYKGAPQGKNATLVTHVAPTTIVDANTIGAAQGSDYTADKYIVTGVVDEVYNATYGNIYIKDADGTRFYIYGLYDQAGNRYDAMTNAPKVGDTITVLTALGQYKGAPQGKNATLVAHTVAETHECVYEDEVVAPTCTAAGYTKHTCECGESYTDTEVAALGHTIVDGVCSTCSAKVATLAEAAALDDNTLVIVTGTVTEIKTAYSETYNNISIILTDANGDTLYVFRLTGNVEVGDQITITGKVGSYNGSKQIAAGATAEITGHVNMLLVGDTNKIVITDATNNGYDYYIVWVVFTADETANYAFVGEGLVIWVYDATLATELTGYTGAAELAAGTYYVCIAANTTLTTGTYNVAVTKTAISTGDTTTTTATFAPADLGFTSSTEFTGPFALDSAISISAKDNDGENPPKYYNATSDAPATLRVYSKDDLTVTAADGYKIVKVVITAHSSKTISGVDKFVASVEGTATFESYVYTLTLSEASSAVTITMGGQVRIVGIEVVYEAE